MQLLTCFSLLGSQFFSKEKIFLAQYLVYVRSLYSSRVGSLMQLMRMWTPKMVMMVCSK